jgi:hypothetical protein
LIDKQESSQNEPLPIRSELWVSQPVKSPRRSWDSLLFGASGVFFFVVVTLVLLRFLPGNKTTVTGLPTSSNQSDQSPGFQVTATLRSLPSTWTPQIAVSATKTQPFRTATPYYTPTFTLTPTISDSNYPEIDLADLYANPDQYANRRLSLSGKIITFGEIELDGELQFAIQIDPDYSPSQGLAPYSPVLILNLLPDVALQVNLPVRVLGKGAGSKITVMVNGIPWGGPVIYGDQWEIIP